MLQPFGELTNRTPSPSQHDGSRVARKHSPWTAARHKKKTRSVQSGLVAPDCEHLERCGNPESTLEPGSISEDFEAEPSLADGFSPATSCCSISPHSSPPVDRDQDAEVHPAKAYIMDQQVTSIDLLVKFADAANSSCRSPVWFGSTAQQQGDPAAEVGQHQPHHHHSSSAPSNILSDRFDAVGQHQADIGSLTDMQQQHDAANSCVCHDAPQAASAATVAPAPAPAAAGRREKLIARRRSWANAEHRKAPAGVGSFGISRLSSNSCASQKTSILAEVALESSRQAAVAAACGPWGQGQQQQDSIPSSLHLCGSIAWSNHSQQSTLDHDIDDFAIRRPSQDMSDLYHPDNHWFEHLVTPGRPSLTKAVEVNSVKWYEQQLAEAADEADLITAQELWHTMQASGLKPSRKFIISYLMCCHYGGGDPFEAEHAVREMCAMTNTEPDAVMAQLLATIDLTWQQLHCAF